MVKDNKAKIMHIRINEKDYELFQVAAVSIGQTPSQLVRMFVDTTINALKIKVQKGEINLEDYKTLLND